MINQEKGNKMTGYLERITGIVLHTNKSVDISLNGKNFIITGGNGSGKTSFLKSALLTKNNVICIILYIVL